MHLHWAAGAGFCRKDLHNLQSVHTLPIDKDSLHHKTITINIASGNEKFYSVGSMISLSSAHWTGEKSIDFKIPPRCSSDIRLATYPTHLLSHPLDSEPFICRKPYDKGSPDPRLPLRNMRQQLLMTHVIIPFLAHHITSHVPAEFFACSFL